MRKPTTILLLIYLGICFLIIQSCETSKEYAEKPNFSYEFDTILKTYKHDFTANYTGGIDILTIGENNFVAYNYCGDNTIKIINHFNDSVNIIPQYNMNCEANYTRIIGDKFYVVDTRNKVRIFDDCGQELESFDLMKIEKFKNSGLTAEWYKTGSDQNVNIPKDILYFRVNQNYDDSLGVYSNYDVDFPAFAKLNVQSKEIDFFGKTPYYSLYYEYGLNSQYYDLYVGDSIITSTAINGQIEIINTIDGMLTSKEVKSQYDTTPIERVHYTEDDENINEIKTKHALVSANYEALFYNPWTKYYYRIFHTAIDEYNENGRLNTEFDKKSILMILNKDFELLDEIEIPVRRQMILKLYPTKNGIAISLPELFEVDKESITFKFLEIKHVQ
ncbi:MAG: DUF4221 domain-containing protein [Brumimicrobium sp.]|nr:DUF4221 domain-containing protein [Brumimicrobium sp.]